MIPIVLTGGHAATTALAVIQQLNKNKSGQLKKLDIHWIGTKYAIEGTKTHTLEYDIFPEQGVEFHHIVTGRIQRKLTRYTLPALLKIPVGFIHALILLSSIRPKVILSFGGFAAFPVVVIGWFLRIPVVIHEQTIAAGRANIYSAPFARVITLAREQSKHFFPNGVVVGNPLHQGIRTITIHKKLRKPSTIFVTGGSRGSENLNSVIYESLDVLLENYVIYHQVGNYDYKRALEVHNKLDKVKKSKYFIFSSVKPEIMRDYWDKCDIVIARAGANTVAEVVALAKPAVFVPLPYTYQDEQTKNALYAKKIGIADVIVQSALTSSELTQRIQIITENWDDMVRKGMKFDNPDLTAAEKLCTIVEELAHDKITSGPILEKTKK
jgi:UDP-N-acetylglucosamine--N-acetylmuramyl-(pentapeptide) pyrophosphoryl-undecaprenol N-acetylglucosamine transferase